MFYLSRGEQLALAVLVLLAYQRSQADLSREVRVLPLHGAM